MPGSSTAPAPSAGRAGAADGYRMALTALGVALDTYLFADPGRPLFVDVASPVRAGPPVGR